MRQLYRKTFSQVHSSVRIEWEDFANMEHTKRRRRIRPLAAAVAAVCLLAALTAAAAVATDFLGLRELLLPQKGKVNVLDEDGVVVPGQMEYKDFLSLAGFSDTAESRALAEWQSFLDSYDQDGAILEKIGNDPTGFEEEYGLYLVYTQEMADELDRIADKYGLRLHRALGLIFPGEWEERIGPFLDVAVNAYTGYAYENGTFQFDGDASLEEYGTVDFQFRRSVKGTMEDVALNIGDAGQYETWGRETAQGVMTTLALGPTKSLILADLGDSFVTVNVLAGTETPIGDVFSSGPFFREDLERLADCFDLSVLAPAVPLDVETFSELPPDAGDETMEDVPPEDVSQEAEAPAAEEDAREDYRLRLYDMTGMEEAPAREFLRYFNSLVQGGYRESAADLLAYPRTVSLEEDTYEVSDGEEFLTYYEDVLTEEVRTRLAAWAETEDLELLTTPGMAGTPDGLVWFGLVEDGEIRIFTLQDADGHGVHGDAPQTGTGE